MHDRTHASFFSGVGGLDLGLERAGWRTVSFSEVDRYASAVLVERWPDVPNLGDIVQLARGRGSDERAPAQGRVADAGDGALHAASGVPAWHGARLWTGGFPCQDLSVAGKRRGLAGTRSGLAFAFLELVERHRPPAVLLENVPGLLSSNAGRDFGTLLASLGQLGYGWAYRVLDARHFGVPQRRRRVFILGIHARVDPSALLAGEVLAVGARCGRHPATGHPKGTRAPAGVEPRPDIIGQAVTAKWSKGTSGPAGDEHHNLTLVRATTDAARDGAPDGLAGRLDDRGELVTALGAHQGGADVKHGQAGHLIPFVKGHRAASVDDDESWRAEDVAPTVNGFDVGDTRATTLIPTSDPEDDPLLPAGLDSNRYRCCGNGVVSSVSEWVGRRLLEALPMEGA